MNMGFRESQRRMNADPCDKEIHVRSVSDRARVEGPHVYLECLRSLEEWNSAGDAVQDLAIAEVGRRLPGYSHVMTRTFDSEVNDFFECEMCEGSGSIRVRTLQMYLLTGLAELDMNHPISSLEPESYVDCRNCDSTGKIRRVRKLNGHRIGVFAPDQGEGEISRHHALSLHLIPGVRDNKWKADKFVDDHGRFLGQEIMPFLMGKTSVTKSLYVEWTNKRNGSSIKRTTDHLPANVGNPDDTREILKENGLRFPTSREWEHACRAGTETHFYWGDRIALDHCWIIDNTMMCDFCRHNRLSHVPGQKCGEHNCACPRFMNGTRRSQNVNIHAVERKCNQFGLVDMIGNYWEFLEENMFSGWSFQTIPQNLKMLYRNFQGGSFIHVGFRATRSIPGI